jgi:membrane protein
LDPDRKPFSISLFLKRVVQVIRETIEGLEKFEIAARAAAISYYGLLSLFPMLLFLVYLASQFLESEAARVAINKSLVQVLPAVAETVQEILNQTIELRGSIGLIGGIGLLWSASTLFNALTTSLNVIWGASPRPFWRRRIVAAVSVLSLGLLFVASMTFSALAVIPSSDDGTIISQWLNFTVGLVITIILFWLVYHWIPNSKEDTRATLGGGILAAILWQGAKAVFGVYLASGITNYGAIYGSLASVIALVLWAYISALIMFIGALFAASLGKVFWPPEGDTSARDAPV